VFGHPIIEAIYSIIQNGVRSEKKTFPFSAYLTACMMAEVVPVDVEDTVVVHMDHLMDHGVLLMLFAKESVLTEKDAVVL
jgi:hypothetical protein